MKKLNGQKVPIIFWVSKVLILAFVISLTSSCRIIEIKENERGVKFEKFNGGLNPDIIYNPGYHVFPIWDRGIIYNIDPVSQNEQLYFSSIDDIRYKINLKLSYRIIPDKIGYLHSEIGANYHESVILKEVEKAISNQLSKQNSNIISSIDTNKLQVEIFQTVSIPILKKHLEITSIEIISISKLE